MGFWNEYDVRSGVVYDEIDDLIDDALGGTGGGGTAPPKPPAGGGGGTGGGTPSKPTGGTAPPKPPMGGLQGFPPGTHMVTDNQGIFNGIWYQKQSDGTVKEGYPITAAQRQQYLGEGGGGTKTGGTSTRTNYAEQNIADRKAALLATGNYSENLPQGFTQIPGTLKAYGPGGRAMEMDKQTNLWSPGFLSRTEQQAALATQRQQTTQAGNQGLRGAIAQSALPPEQRTAPATAAANTPAIPGAAGMAGTLRSNQGVTLPGFERYNQPGLGIDAQGLRTMYGSDQGLNVLRAGRDNGPPIQFGPGLRRGDQTGNSIAFGGSRSGATPDYSITPQMRFGPTAVSVPGTWERGVGNTGDANRAIDVPFNIGPQGASTFNLAGSNVQLNSADKSTGMGFALTPQTPSARFAATDFGAATGRDLITGPNMEKDPAIQAAQSLSLIAALNQLGGGPGAITALTAPNAAQYSGNAPQGQGTWFSGLPVGPQGDDRELLDYKRGGMVASLPMGRASRPFAAGGRIIAPVAPGETAPELAQRSAQPAPANAQAQTAPQSAALQVSNDGGVESTPVNIGELDTTGLADANALAPFQQAANLESAKARARESQGYIYRRAGLSQPTAVPIVAGMQGNLGPGQYWDTISSLNRSITGIANKQNTLRELGGNEDYAATTGQIAALQQQAEPFKKAMGYQTQLQGLGDVGDPDALNAQIAGVRQQMGPLGDVVAAQQKLTSLGQPYSDEDIAATIAEIQRVQDLLNQGAPPDPNKPITPEAMGELIKTQQQYQASLLILKNQLSQKQAHNNAVQQAQQTYQNLLNATGLPYSQIASQVGQYQTQLDALNQQVQNAQQAAQLRATIAALVGAGVDPTAKYAAIQAQLDPLQSSAAGILSRNAQRTQLAQEIQNLVAAGPPKFAKGGNWIAGATKNAHGQFAAKAERAGMSTRAYASKMADAPGKTGKQARLAKTLMGFKGGGKVTAPKQRMVTPEEIIGIGRQTGKPYFRVGEPRTPGGPPAPELLTIKPLPMGRRQKVAA